MANPKLINQKGDQGYSKVEMTVRQANIPNGLNMTQTCFRHFDFLQQVTLESQKKICDLLSHFPSEDYKIDFSGIYTECYCLPNSQKY